MTLIYHEPSTRDDESTRERQKERKRNQSSGATGTEEAKTMKKERALRKQSEKRRGVVESAVLEYTGGWGCYWGCCGSADASSMASSGGYPSFLALPGYWTRATYSVRRQNTETEPHREEKAREAARVNDQKSEKT